jgi:uncharacterized protein (TIRG00374 family)
MSTTEADSASSQRYRPFHLPKLDIRWLRYLVPLILIGLAVHLLLPQVADLEKSGQVLKSMSRWLLLLAIILQIGSYVGSGLLLQGLVRLTGGQLSVGRGIIINLASSSIGVVAAGIVGSSVATYNWIRATGASAQGAGLAATLKSVFNNGLLLVLSIFGLIHLIVAHDLSSAQTTAFLFIVVLLLLIIGGLVWGAIRPEALAVRLNAMTDWWAKRRGKTADPDVVARNVSQLHNSWIALRQKGWQLPLLGSAVNIGFDILTIYALFFAAGQSISFGVLLTGYGLPLLLGKAGFLPGGVGIVEATMTAIYTSLGISADVVVVVILGYRLISFWIPILVGFPLAAYLQRTMQVKLRNEAHT